MGCYRCVLCAGSSQVANHAATSRSASDYYGAKFRDLLDLCVQTSSARALQFAADLALAKPVADIKIGGYQSVWRNFLLSGLV